MQLHLQLLLAFWLQSCASIHLAVPTDIDLDVVRILASHLNPTGLLSFYKASPAVQSDSALCSSLSEGAWAVLLPSRPLSNALIASFSTKLSLPSLSVTITRPMGDPTSSILLSPSHSLISHPIHSLLEEHSASTGNPEVAILYEAPEDLNTIQYLLQLPTQAFLVRLPPDDDFRPALKHVSIRLGVDQMVVFLSSSRILSLLHQAAAMNMCTGHYHYILANLDSSTIELSSTNTSNHAGGGPCNVTAFSLFDPRDERIEEIRKVLKRGGYVKLPHNGLSIETILVYDAIESLLHAESILGVRGAPSCDGERYPSWNHGNEIIHHMANNSDLRPLSGPLMFGLNGKRINETVHVWRTRKTGMEQDLDWLESEGKFIVKRIETPATVSIQKKNSLENQTLRVTVYLEEPFVIRRIPKAGQVLEGNDRYEGYCIDLLRHIASILKFKYIIHEVHDRAYGSREPNGKWNGMVGELQNGEADLAVASLTISYSRSGIIDFSVPYMHLGISILFRRTEGEESSLSTFLAPLSPIVWLSVFIAYVLTSLVICCLSKISPYESLERDDLLGTYNAIRNQFSLRNAFWFSVSSLMQQGSELSPRAGSVRVASAAWWMFSLILISSYTANLAAFLTTRRMVSPIENADDLSRQSKIKFGTLGRGSTMTFFNESRVDTYERMWKMMTGQPGLFVESSGEGIARVRGGDYAYLMESSMLEYAVERDCRLMQIGGLLDQKGYGVGLPKGIQDTVSPLKRRLTGSPYREAISTAILQLQEKTMLTELKERWWRDENVVCERPRKGGDNTDDDSISGVFVVLFIGILISLIVAIMERIIKTCREGKKQQSTPLDRRVWGELRDAIWERSRDNELLKRTIDGLIKENVREGRPQGAYENSYTEDSFNIEGE